MKKNKMIVTIILGLISQSAWSATSFEYEMKVAVLKAGYDVLSGMESYGSTDAEIIKIGNNAINATNISAKAKECLNINADAEIYVTAAQTTLEAFKLFNNLSRWEPSPSYDNEELTQIDSIFDAISTNKAANLYEAVVKKVAEIAKKCQ